MTESNLNDETRLAQVFRHLRALGLSPEAAQSYVAILRMGIADYDQLSAQLDLTKPQCIEAVKQLLISNLILQDVDESSGRPVFGVLDPSVAFQGFGLQASWRRPAHFSTPSEWFAPSLSSEEIDRIRGEAEHIAKLIQSMQIQTEQPPPRNVQRAINEEQMAKLLAHALGKARKTVLALSAPPHLRQTALIVAGMQSGISEGVRYRRVCAMESIISFGLDISRDDIEKRKVDVRVVEDERIAQKFYVVDKSTIVSFNPEARGPYRFALSGQVVRNTFMAKRFRNQFERLWKMAIPGMFAIDQLRSAANEILARASLYLDKTGVEWLEGVINRGEFFNPPLTEADLKPIVTVALDRRLVERNGQLFGNYVPKYSISIREIRDRWDRQQTL